MEEGVLNKVVLNARVFLMRVDEGVSMLRIFQRRWEGILLTYIRASL